MKSQSQITHAQLTTLLEVSQKINSQLNLNKLLDEIMDLVIDLLHAEKGLILFRDSESGELSVRAARYMNKRSIDDVVALSRSIVRQAESEGKPILLERVPDISASDSSESLMRYKIKSVVCVPLRAKTQSIGTIYLDTTNSEHFFKKDDLMFLEAFSNLAGMAIENAKSYEAIDELNANLEEKVKQRTSELEGKHTELEGAYEDLKLAQLHLIRTEKMASLGMLVAGVAHELNTPIGAMKSSTQMLTSTVDKLCENSAKDQDEKTSKALRILQQLSEISNTACQRMTCIVRNLRDFARLDEEEFKWVNLHDGIDSTVSLVEHLRENRIEIVKDYGEIPSLRCYANQLNQVFMNLLVNACQAIEGQGRVTLKTYAEENNIFVQVQDTGKGIPAENLENIFDPGFTTKGVGVGTGLGLSISYKIVEEHKGEIEVESEVGKGTTFTLRLPVRSR